VAGLGKLAVIMLSLSPPRPPVATAKPVAIGARAGRTSGFYRYDLDGLRGIAIALVAMFHVWFGRVSGGVDVFLALSGFFFGGKILRAALDPALSLSPVAEVIRLVRRLVPALVVVLAACALLTILVQPQTRWETFADQSLASLGYYQNWELASTASDYLRAGEAVTPLQHIWSMSVQGQFYIAFLLLVAGCAYLFRGPRAPYLRSMFVVLLSVLTLASFIYAIFAHQTNQTTAYYNSFARAWELLLGALVGALVPYVRWPMWLRTGVATVALAAVLSCGAFIDGVNEFPGPWALVPVGATMLMVLAGANLQAGSPGDLRDDRMPLPNRLLATAPLVTLGAMAYSLYLWHWPLLIFWLSYTGHIHANFLEGTAILLVSGLLAYLTIRLVEDPLRYRAPSAGSALPVPPVPWQSRLRRPTIVLGSTVVLLGVTLTATSFTWRQHVIVLRAAGKELSALSAQDYPGARALTAHVRVPTLPMRPTVLEVKEDLPDSTRDGCISDFVNPAVVNCTYGDLAAIRTIALAGGSHAEHWLPALEVLGQLHHFKVVTYLKMGCPLSTEEVPLIMGNNAAYPQCREWVQRTMAKLVADRPDYVFTTSTRPWNIKPGDVMPATYIGIWQTLSDNNIPILAIRDSPWLVKNNKPFDPADCLAKGGSAQSCEIKRSDVLADHNSTVDFVGQFPLLKPLDMSDAICRPDFCRPVEGNVLIYHGAHHLSPTYVRTMAPELGRQIGANTGWW
jgi:peptidoglycan/LPS O-acetylase OafA/YrhL